MTDLGPASCDAPLKRVFSIDIEVCGRCGGSVRVIVDASNRCIEDQNIIIPGKQHSISRDATKKFVGIVSRAPDRFVPGL